MSGAELRVGPVDWEDWPPSRPDFAVVCTTCGELVLGEWSGYDGVRFDDVAREVAAHDAVMHTRPTPVLVVGSYARAREDWRVAKALAIAENLAVEPFPVDDQGRRVATGGVIPADRATWAGER